MEATNRLEFCISCHEMRNPVFQEYKRSRHYKNPSGVQAICADCHVPKAWVAKFVRKLKASQEVYYWLTGSIDTLDKFEAKRFELASKVWTTMKQNDSRACRSCHTPALMALMDQALFAAKKHRQGFSNSQTCIDCHKGLTHQLPIDAVAEIKDESPVDLDLGEEINETCAGCHGEFGEGTLDGEYPRLAGLDTSYIVKQLESFKNRNRLNIPMLPYATERELPEEDVNAIAGFLSQIELPTRLPPIDKDNFNALNRLQASKKVINIPRYAGNINAGERFYRKECAACHGVEGVGNKALFVPQLQGQHSQYLRRQIDKFKKGVRIHEDEQDQAIFEQFSDADISNLLAYLSILDDD